MGMLGVIGIGLFISYKITYPIVQIANYMLKVQAQTHNK